MCTKEGWQIEDTITDVKDVGDTENHKWSQRLYINSAITATHMFKHAGRGGKVYWEDKGDKGPMVVL